MRTSTILTKFFKERTGLLELILVAVVIGFSVELLASAFINILKLPDFWNLVLGGLILFVSSFYFVYRIFTLKSSTYKISGFVTYSKEKKIIIPVPEYKFGEDMFRCFFSAVKENGAIKKQWDSEPPDNCFSTLKDGTTKYTNPKSHQLIVQLIEYFLLKSLSTHLSGHFDNEMFSKENLTTFERQNIPQILFENIFLELFSKPMEQRPAFVDDIVKDKKKNKQEKIIATFKDGFMFEHFELILPKGSQIRREKKNKIIIETPRINLTFIIDFGGYNTTLPYDFEKYFIGIDDKNEIIYYQFDIHCLVNFKLKTFVTNSGWDYFTWIDSFIDELDKKVSKKRFLDNINWRTAETMIRVFKNLSNESKKDRIEDAEVLDDKN